MPDRDVQNIKSPIANPGPGFEQTESRKNILLLSVIVIAIFLLLAGIGGWLIFRVAKNHPPKTEAEAATKLVKQLEQYPAAYTQANLPQYPEASVISLSNADAQPADTISLILTTNDSSAQAAQFFDSKLKAIGWKPSSKPVPFTNKLYFRAYQKNNQQFSFTAQTSKADGQTTITIEWKEI